jgi:rubredoxin
MVAQEASMSEYRCRVCGYIYDEWRDGGLFAFLPDDWACPVGIATQDPAMLARLNVDESARWLANFLRVSTEELRDFARLTGSDDVHKLSVRDLATANSEISSFTKIPHA